MNELNLAEIGGFPLRQNRLGYMQVAIRDAFKRIINGFNKQLSGYDGYVLHGCAITATATDVSITAGSVVFNDEIWAVPAATIAIPVDNDQLWYIEPYLVDDAAGLRQYADGLTKATQKNRDARIAVTSYANTAAMDAALGGVAAASFFILRITDGVPETEDFKPAVLGTMVHGEMRNLRNPNTYSSAAWSNAAGNIHYRKSMDGIVHISGWKGLAGSAINGVIGTLPVGFRPVDELHVLWNAAPPETYFLIIRTNGEMEVVESDLTTTSTVGGTVTTWYTAA